MTTRKFEGLTKLCQMGELRVLNSLNSEMSFVINVFKSVGGVVAQPFKSARNKLRVGGWLGMEAMKEAIAEEILRKNISQETFNFNGNELYKLTRFCQICGQCRFTEEDVEFLSDPGMCFFLFSRNFPESQYEIKGCCRQEECQHKLFVLTGGFDAYRLDRAFQGQYGQITYNSTPMSAKSNVSTGRTEE